MDFYDHINNGEKYICDKCEVVELREDEFNEYTRNKFHYCEECWNYINLKKWACKCGNTGTIRSERMLPKTCPCGELTCLL